MLSAIAPARRVVEVSGGTWTFKGFGRESVVADASASGPDGNVVFVATWEFTEKDDASFGSGSSSEDGTGESPEKDASSSGLPQTEMPWAQRLALCLSHQQ